MNLTDFTQVWLADFEYDAPPGERPTLRCMVAHEYQTGRKVRVWADQLSRMAAPPFPVDASSLFVAYYASAELGCFLQLGWPMPTYVLDLFTEFRCQNNGLRTVRGNGLLGAMAQHGLPTIGTTQKTEMRDLALRGGNYTESERMALLNYCETDVVALANLLSAMLPKLDLPHALLRGRYMAAAARMEHTGTPIDVEVLTALRESWSMIKSELVVAVDQDYGIYVPTKTGVPRFSSAHWAKWLARNDIPWPRLESGSLALDDDTFRMMAKRYPKVAPIRELRHTIGQLRLNDLAVGTDGRNRCMLSAFSARTGRNQPSNSKFIFGPSCWLRSLIKPEPGRAVAYVDWSQQEFGIAASLSGDQAMLDAYTSGDPYLAFAVQAGEAPPNATKKTHATTREVFKVCALAVQYGMGERSLAASLDKPEVFARRLLRLHRETYSVFWKWSGAVVNHAELYGGLHTVFGWAIHLGAEVNHRSLANFPMQANGAEMLRLACCLATERGINVCAPIHDALLVEGPVDSIGEVVADAQAAMADASRTILGGLELRTDSEVVRYPDRYVDPRGERMWAKIIDLMPRGGVSA